MDTTQPLSLEESMKEVMQTLPPVIRDYLVQGKYTPVAISLANKYKLRIDQSGVLEREIMLLLMGVENPDEFVQALVEEAKLDKPTVDGLVQDVNTQIFMPLRKAEEISSTKPVSSTPQTPAPAPVPAHIAPLPPKITMPQVSRSAIVAAPARSINLLEDHEEPHIEFAKAPVMPVAPAAPRMAPAPTNLPGMMPPSASAASAIQFPPLPKPAQPAALAPEEALNKAPSLLERMAQPQVTAPAASVVTPVAPVQPRSSDPYREPIDEPVDEM